MKPNILSSLFSIRSFSENELYFLFSWHNFIEKVASKLKKKKTEIQKQEKTMKL